MSLPDIFVFMLFMHEPMRRFHRFRHGNSVTIAALPAIVRMVASKSMLFIFGPPIWRAFLF
jgi:hypothetical protein